MCRDGHTGELLHAFPNSQRVAVKITVKVMEFSDFKDFRDLSERAI